MSNDRELWAPEPSERKPVDVRKLDINVLLDEALEAAQGFDTGSACVQELARRADAAPKLRSALSFLLRAIQGTSGWQNLTGSGYIQDGMNMALDALAYAERRTI